MKHTRVSLLALSALAGGVFAASAADVGTNYPLNALFQNGQTLVDVTGIPGLSTTELTSSGFGVVMTDGSGKINGVQYLTITNLSGTGLFSSANFIADISGSVKSSGKPAVPSVKLTGKGNGYAQNAAGTTQALASVNFTFTSVGGISSHTSFVGPFTTNVTLIGLASDGTTNYGPYTYTYTPPTTNLVFQSAYQTLTFTVNSNWSTSTTALGTTNVINQTNVLHIYTDSSIVFGTPLFTNVYPASIGASNFNQYIIATNSSGGTVVGYASSNITAVTTAFITANTLTNTGTTNVLVNSGTTNILVFVQGMITNNAYSYTNPPSTYTGLPNTSNSWQEVDGTITGTIKAGKSSKTLSEPGTLTTGSHFVYNTPTTVSNGVIVTYTGSTGAGNVDLLNIDSLSGNVVTFGKSLWISDPSDSWNYSGKGTMSTKTTKISGVTTTSMSYTATLKGVAGSQGSSVSISGTNGLLVLATQPTTNLVTFTNLAALPGISAVATNSAGYTVNVNFSLLTTNSAVSTNEVIALSRWWVPVPPAFTSNNVPNAIISVNAKGKVMGQSLILTNGINNPDF